MNASRRRFLKTSAITAGSALEMCATRRTESRHCRSDAWAIALLAVGESPAHLTRKQLLAAEPVAKSSDDWEIQTDSGTLAFRPFASIMSERYRLYQDVES